MNVAIASDHAGYPLKDLLVRDLRDAGYSVEDLGTDNPDTSTDYPDFCSKLAEALMAGEADRGIMVCGSGVGACITMNKFAGLRAAPCHDSYSAHQGVEHDDMNVLCLGGRIIGSEPAREITRQFLDAKFSGESRHVRRLGKINEIEKRFLKETD